MTCEEMKQLKNDIHDELKNVVNNSKLGDVLQKYGIQDNIFVKFDCILDLTKIQFSDAICNEQVKSEERVTLLCCRINSCICCSC